MASPQDLALARAVAERVAAAGKERVQRVYLVGSRALGTARPDSDLDPVALEEPSPQSLPWRSGDFARERARIAKMLGPTPVRVDLWVRTTDRFAVARGVIGGVEWLAAQHGIEVFSRAVSRPPLIQHTLEEIRRQNVSAWIEHSCAALDAAVPPLSMLFSRPAMSAAAVDDIIEATVERAVTAVLVLHQVYVPKSAGVGAMLDRLARLEPRLAQSVRERLATQPPTLSALEVLRTVVARLSEDPSLARSLAGPRERLRSPRMVID